MDGLTLKKLLRQADENGFAIPSFNYSDIWDFKAIVEAAEEEEAPVMIASNPLVVAELGAKICGGFANVAMEEAKIPLVHHLDHFSGGNVQGVHRLRVSLGDDRRFKI